MQFYSRIIFGYALCCLVLAPISSFGAGGLYRGGIAMGEAPAAWHQWPVGRIYKPSAPPTIAPHSLHEYFPAVPSDKEKVPMQPTGAARVSAARTVDEEVVCVDDSDDDEVVYVDTHPSPSVMGQAAGAASIDASLWAALIEGAEDLTLDASEISDAAHDLLGPMLLETDESTAEGFINRVIKVSMDVIPIERESFWKMLDDLRDPAMLIKDYLSIVEALGAPGTTHKWRIQLLEDITTNFPLEINSIDRAKLFCAMAKEPSAKRAAAVGAYFRE